VRELGNDQKARLKQFHQDGLLWLVNTALLHPRGWALTIHLDASGEPTGLGVQGDGVEPWIFAPGENADVLQRYEQAEARREATVSSALEQAGAR
jgi:hypothetical protein